MNPHRHFRFLPRLALLLLAVFAAIRPAAAQYAASPLTQLSMTSQPGDYIGQGKSYLFNANDGTFSVTSSSDNYVTITFSQGSGGQNWSLSFATNHLGTSLATGTYTQAERAPFAETGHPGLEVYGDSRGSNTLTGKFTVGEVKFDYSGAQPRLVSFAASFEQHSEGQSPALTGTIYYNSYNHPGVLDTSTPTTTVALNGTLGKYGRYAGPVQVTLNATDPDGAADVAATYYVLDGGSAQTYTAPFTVSGDGLHSLNFWSVDQAGNKETTHLQSVQSIWIDTSGPTNSPPLSQLTMESQPGDYIGGGQTYLYNTSDGQFTASASAQRAPNNADYVTIAFNGGGHWWYLTLATNNLGVGLTPGEYDGAMRAAFTASGHPGLDVSGDGRGSNTLTGKFTVLDAVFDYSTSSTQPQVVSFAATFEQHSEGGAPALTGAIYYNSTAYPTYFPAASLSLAPAAVPGGMGAIGTITLSHAAGAGGQVVTLSSQNPAVATVPTSITFPAGAATATFPVSTQPVTAGQFVTLQATAGGATQSATLAIESPPMPLYHLYGPGNNDHLYTVDPAERAGLIAGGWLDGGSLGSVPGAPTGQAIAGLTPVHRLFSPSAGYRHVLSATDADRAALAAAGWLDEGVKFSLYAAPGPGLLPLFRLYSAQGNAYYCTTSQAEHDYWVANGLADAGTLGYLSAGP